MDELKNTVITAQMKQGQFLKLGARAYLNLFLTNFSDHKCITFKKEKVKVVW